MSTNNTSVDIHDDMYSHGLHVMVHLQIATLAILKIFQFSNWRKTGQFLTTLVTTCAPWQYTWNVLVCVQFKPCQTTQDAQKGVDVFLVVCIKNNKCMWLVPNHITPLPNLNSNLLPNLIPNLLPNLILNLDNLDSLNQLESIRVPQLLLWPSSTHFQTEPSLGSSLLLRLCS